MTDNIRGIFGTHDEKTLVQLRDVASRADGAALMADGHLGYVMPIGGVAAYTGLVSPVGVGFDIACGNAAIRTDMNIGQYSSAELETLADMIQEQISFGVGRTNAADDAPVDDPLFEAPEWALFPHDANAHNLKGKARSQLGTVGSGNHYVDVFSDETGRVWVGVHFGSRGFGHTIASGFLSLSQGKRWTERVPEQERLLNIHDGDIGEAYWHLMNLAGRYAYAGREWVARKVVEMIGAKEVEMVHNHHNFAWLENPATDMIVIRKGATPAFPGQLGFVGGSMGDDAVILRGVDPVDTDDPAATLALQESAYFSTVHGAGRVMSRTEAAGKVNRKTGEVKKVGKVTWDMVREWIGPRGVILRGGGLDESPQAYRRLPDVLKAQGPTVEVLHTLTPVIVVMAGANEFDPYKD